MNGPDRDEIWKMIAQATSSLEARLNGLTGAFGMIAHADATVITSATLTAPTAGILATCTGVVRGPVNSPSGGSFPSGESRFLVMATGVATIGAVEAAGATISLLRHQPNTVGALVNETGGVLVGGGADGAPVQMFGSAATTAITVAASTGSLQTDTLCSSTGLNGLAASALSMPFALAGIFGGHNSDTYPNGTGFGFSIAGTVATTTLQLTNFAFTFLQIPLANSFNN
jgi:hypothetical protein